jgi:hypothetical protein
MQPPSPPQPKTGNKKEGKNKEKTAEVTETTKAASLDIGLTCDDVSCILKQNQSPEDQRASTAKLFHTRTRAKPAAQPAPASPAPPHTGEQMEIEEMSQTPLPSQ